MGQRDAMEPLRPTPMATWPSVPLRPALIGGLLVVCLAMLGLGIHLASVLVAASAATLSPLGAARARDPSRTQSLLPRPTMAQPIAPPVPHFLRFARAIALVSGLGSVTAGCYASHEAPPGGDAGSRPDVRVIPDAPPPPRDTGTDAPVVARDAPVTCVECFCDYGSGTDGGGAPSCESLGLWECCAVIGPLSPPDLPA